MLLSVEFKMKIHKTGSQFLDVSHSGGEIQHTGVKETNTAILQKECYFYFQMLYCKKPHINFYNASM